MAERQDTEDVFLPKRSARTQRLTEAGEEYQRETKLKVFRQLLRELQRDGELLLKETLTSSPELDHQTVSSKLSNWRHQYVVLHQTNADLQPLMAVEGYREHMSSYKEKLSELASLKERLELHVEETGTAPKRKPSKAGSERSSVKSRSSSSSVRGKLYLMKLEEEQNAAEIKAKMASLEEKQRIQRQYQELEKQRLELKWKEERHQLETEIRITEAKSKAIHHVEREIDSSMLCTATEQVGRQESTRPDLSAHCASASAGNIQRPESSEHAGQAVQDPQPAVAAVLSNSNSVYCVPPVHGAQPTASSFPLSYQSAAPIPPPQVRGPDVVDILVEHSRRNQLPPIEPGTFRGDAATFPLWMKAFETYIEARCISPSERLHYLGHYTAGEAKSAIVGYLQMATDDAYLQAKKRLIDRYGNEFVRANELKKRLYKWPEVKAGDSKALTELGDFLEHCLVVASSNVSEHGMFGGAEEVDRILGKLPGRITDSWRRVVDRWIYEPTVGAPPQYPPFSEFVAFIVKEARVVSGPVRATETGMRGSGTGGARYGRMKTDKNARVFFASAPSHSRHRNDGRPQQRYHCPACQADHNATECARFANMSLKERQDLVHQESLCRGCLKRGHKWMECKKKQRCDKCKRLHPTMLHDDSLTPQIRQKTEESSQTTTSLHVTSSEPTGLKPKCTHSMLVPVHLKHKNRPEMKETVYALLDPQSDACFVKESVLQSAGLNGESINLEVNTMNGKAVTKSEVMHGLIVEDFKGEVEIELPSTYSKGDIPADRDLIPRRDTTAKWRHLEAVSRELPEYFPDAEIGILIGLNCPKAIKPLEVVAGDDNEPWAIRTSLGWSVVGYMGETSSEAMCLYVSADGQEKVRHFAFRIKAREVHSGQIARMMDADFEPHKTDDTKISQEDSQFIDIMKQEMRQRPDGHFEAPLPLKDRTVIFPNNKEQAHQRLQGLKRRLQKDVPFKEAYVSFVQEMLDKGYAEHVPSEELEAEDGHVWYVPHHGVFHPKKNKIRVVFDCSAEFRGYCLNRELLQGPDVSNNLAGILVRFRKDSVAVTCDIESMFNQVKVQTRDRNLLRFLWWPAGDTSQEPVELRMTTHLFGATSSPSCAMSALNKTAETYRDRYGNEAADFITRNFYVDDGLVSTTDEQKAIDLVHNTTKMCAGGGFKLTKFASNNPEVLETIPIYSRTVNLVKEKMFEQALGILWNVCDDTFHFKIDIPERPPTRRGILSAVSSVYDPLGLISPFILRGKMMLKRLCCSGCVWDDPVPDEILDEWTAWKAELPALSHLGVPRQYGGIGLRTTGARYELHHFCDASLSGYGVCSYLRVASEDGTVSSDLVMAKSRVTPKRAITVPRLELSAAVLATRVKRFLDRELHIPNLEHYFWCDSRVVLGYIRNRSRRFHVFVANRVQEILDTSSVSRWHHIPTEENPSDLASRGGAVVDLMDNDLWWHGPRFLATPTDLPLDDTSTEQPLDPNDPEVKAVSSFRTQASEPVTDGMASLTERLTYFSSWYSAKRAVANCLRFKRKLQAKCGKARSETDTEGRDRQDDRLTVQDLQEAEAIIIKSLQREAFKDEYDFLPQGTDVSDKELDPETLKTAQQVKKRSSLRQLDPMIGRDGIIRVGGRIRRANLPRSVTNPVILPKSGHVTTLILRQCHIRTAHAGRETTLGAIRSHGYWILHGRSVVSTHIRKCVVCKRLRGAASVQKMSDLPEERLEPSAPFTFCGVDCFGPFYVRERRSELKRWGIIFTCLASRAVHLETVNSMSTDAFLNAYRRFICRRGPVRRLYCDNGTNFVGGQGALKLAMKEMDENRIKTDLLKDNCDWIDFEFNVPQASHMGGIWERMIRCARSALTGLLVANGQQLDDELLRTLMCEVEEIINSRPISVCDMTHTNLLEPLTPNLLLTQKCRVVLPFPGRFARQDLYGRRRWRRTQYLSNMFWTRWQKEIVSALQERRKWTKEEPNFEVHDIVLVTEDDRPRSQWPLGRVVRVYPSGDKLIRKVRVKVGASEYDRPIHRLIMLLRASEDSPSGSR